MPLEVWEGLALFIVSFFSLLTHVYVAAVEKYAFEQVDMILNHLSQLVSPLRPLES